MEDTTSSPGSIAPSVSDLPPYGYTALSDPANSIRLSSLLPGETSEPIKIAIIEVEPATWVPPPSQRLEITELNKLLPLPESGKKSWRATRTKEGRYLFLLRDVGHKSGYYYESSWSPPDSANISPDLYEGIPEAPLWEPRYEALSYCWGSPGNDVFITVVTDDAASNGLVPTLSRLSIRRNLHAALIRLRHVARPRTLWVDAVCINQDDMHERSTQVVRMNGIFSMAERVVIWLGEGDSGSDDVLSALDNAGSQVEFCEGGHVTVDRFFNRDWFDRVWVIQEVQIARGGGQTSLIVCGDGDISYPRFVRRVEQLLGSEERPSSVYISKITQRDLRVAPLPTALSSASSRLCTVEHNYLYGVWSLLDKGFSSGSEPDYSRPWYDTLREFTAAHLKYFQRFDLISLLDSDEDMNQPSLPSWVFHPDKSDQAFYAEGFSAGYTRSCLKFPSPQVITATGLVTGAIAHVSDSIIQANLDSLAEWQMSRTLDDISLTSLYLAACVGNIAERWPGHGLVSLSDLDVDEVKSIALFSREAPASISSLKGTALRRVELRRLVETTDGGLGVCPPNARPGDEIAVFLGCDAPLAIRHQQDGTYTVVGACLLPHLWDAKALLGPVPAPWRVQVNIENTRRLYTFVNEYTGEYSFDDPRLGPLDGWERIEVQRTNEHPAVCQFFRNMETGDVVDWDPRMAKEALEARGVKFEEIHLS